MKLERISEEMATLDGYLRVAVHYPNGSIRVEISDNHYKTICGYLNCHNAVQRVVGKLSDVDTANAVNCLCDVLGIPAKFPMGCVQDLDRLMKASPTQKCEAVLKALGKWETIK